MNFLQKIGGVFFKFRDKLPVPLVLAMVYCSRPKKWSWIAGLPFIVLGESLRVWGLMHIGPTTRTRDICADKLVTSGPYSHCRNPLYFANVLKIFGILIVSGNFYYAIITLAFYAIEFVTMIPFEENFLAEKFSEAHKAYRAEVPAFFPTARPNAKFNEPPSFSLMESLKSEKKTFASTGAILFLLALIQLFRKEETVGK